MSKFFCVWRDFSELGPKFYISGEIFRNLFILFQFFLGPTSSVFENSALISDFISFARVRQELFCSRLVFSECQIFLGLVSYRSRRDFGSLVRLFLGDFTKPFKNFLGLTGFIFFGWPDIFCAWAKFFLAWL